MKSLHFLGRKEDLEEHY